MAACTSDTAPTPTPIPTPTASPQIAPGVAANSSALAGFFNLITNVAIVAAVLGMITFVGYLMFIEPKEYGYSINVTIRIVSVVTGFLIYFGSKAVGISIPELMLSAIATTNTLLISMVGILIPGVIGAIVGWYCVRAIQSHFEVAIRVLAIVATFVLVLFGDAYAAASASNIISKQGINLSLLPNLTFIIGLALYFTLKYIPER